MVSKKKTGGSKRNSLCYEEEDRAMRSRAKEILPPPPKMPSIDADPYEDKLKAEIDGIERCLGLVDVFLTEAQFRQECLELQCKEADLMDDFGKLYERLNKKAGEIRTLKRLQKSFKHFIRQCKRDMSWEILP